MKNILKATALLALTLPLLLAAEETDLEHIAVGTRPIPKEVSQDVEESEERLSSGYYDSYYSNSYHWVKGIGHFGDTLELEDGSIWTISAYDASKVLSWLSNDTIVLTKNHGWFTSYNYRLVNKITGASVEANLYLGPLKNGIYTRYITSIYPISCTVQLSDGTFFQAKSSDYYTFQSWAMYDTVILGFDKTEYDRIVINVNMNNCVRAKQI